jgi:predicted nucleic acid-binding protein
VKWLLDTNVISEPLRPRPNARVLDWIKNQHSGNTVISIVTSAELRDGASSVRDQSRSKQLTEWIEATISQEFRDRTLPLTIAILIDWIRLGRRLRARGISREPGDLLIASTARVHNLVVVSRNVKDFASTGVILYDPWTGKNHNMDAP